MSSNDRQAMAISKKLRERCQHVECRHVDFCGRCLWRILPKLLCFYLIYVYGYVAVGTEVVVMDIVRKDDVYCGMNDEYDGKRVDCDCVRDCGKESDVV